MRIYFLKKFELKKKTCSFEKDGFLQIPKPIAQIVEEILSFFSLKN